MGSSARTGAVRLIVIDSARDASAAVQALLRTRTGRPYDIRPARTVEAGMAALERAGADVVMLCLDAAAGTVASAARQISDLVASGACSPLVLLSGARDPAFEAAALVAGAADVCWVEEVSAPLLETQIRHARAHAAARAESHERRTVENALRESEAQLRVMLHEREVLERQFYQSQKMETVGRMAGGIAHDFNSILTAIVSFGTLLAEHVAGDSLAERNAKEILAAADRASALTRQLLAFGRRQVLHPVRLDLNETVDGIAGMLRRVIGEDVDLQIGCTGPIQPVRADQGQLESALMNLVVNARDAMPQGGGRS